MIGSKRYLLCPGRVRSENDGQIHYVSAERLAQFYRVPMSEYVVWKDGCWRGRDLTRLIRLFPDPRGHYRVPENEN